MRASSSLAGARGSSPLRLAPRAAEFSAYGVFFSLIYILSTSENFSLATHVMLQLASFSPILFIAFGERMGGTDCRMGGRMVRCMLEGYLWSCVIDRSRFYWVLESFEDIAVRE